MKRYILKDDCIIDSESIEMSNLNSIQLGYKSDKCCKV